MWAYSSEQFLFFWGYKTLLCLFLVTLRGISHFIVINVRHFDDCGVKSRKGVRHFHLFEDHNNDG